MSAELGRALDELAARILGEPAGDPADRPRGGGAVRGGGSDSPGAVPGAAAADDRTALLRGAALLTGRADLAQDAGHVGAARVWRSSDRRPDRVRLCAEVLRVIREPR